jgi:curved DNA-binding protein CbpA
MIRGITWYDVLGVLPGASTEQIEVQYDDKISLLRPELVAGAPSMVLTAASRAERMLKEAHRILSDPGARRSYDQMAGISRSDGGLARDGSFDSQLGSESWDGDIAVSSAAAEALGVLMQLTDWLAPGPYVARRVVVPDLRGLFHSVCFDIAGKLDLRINVVRLTARPMPVDGLVVDQSPRPPAKARRASELTVQVWHPSVRSPRSRMR